MNLLDGRDSGISRSLLFYLFSFFILENAEGDSYEDLKLPDPYKRFLLEYNGGFPTASTFKISDEEGESVVNKFYGIGDMKGNLARVFESLDGELPEGFISIANDPGGNEICIGTSEKYYGNIFLWIHDMESDEEMGNMISMANSFERFFDNLY